jgi:mRNA interferase MazF
MGMVINQYEVFLIELDPARSPDEMNHTISTVIIAPMTTRSYRYPTRVELQFGGKQGWIVLDQIRTVDRLRLLKKLGKIERPQIVKVKAVLKEMFVDW